MNRADALAAITGRRIAHLATVKPGGHPHVVPITFAVTGEALVTMVDHKPKTTQRLQRLTNIEAQPNASVLVDHYEEDWTSLWWVRVDGHARVLNEGTGWEAARAALADKYVQYRSRPPEGPAILIPLERVTWWSSTP